MKPPDTSIRDAQIAALRAKLRAGPKLRPIGEILFAAGQASVTRNLERKSP